MNAIRTRRNSIITAAAFTLTCAVGTVAAPAANTTASDDATTNDRAAPALADRFGAIAPLVGYEWTIDTQWTDGTALRARNQYRVGLNGQFVVADLFTSDAGREEYHRYHTVFVIDPGTGELKAHGFTFDGTASVVGFEIKASDDGDTVLEAITDNPGGRLRQSIELEGERYIWNVWFQPAGSDDWMPMMVDGVWNRGKKL